MIPAIRPLSWIKYARAGSRCVEFEVWQQRGVLLEKFHVRGPSLGKGAVAAKRPTVSRRRADSCDRCTGLCRCPPTSLSHRPSSLDACARASQVTLKSGKACAPTGPFAQQNIKNQFSKFWFAAPLALVCPLPISFPKECHFFVHVYFGICSARKLRYAAISGGGVATSRFYVDLRETVAFLWCRCSDIFYCLFAC